MAPWVGRGAVFLRDGADVLAGLVPAIHAAPFDHSLPNEARPPDVDGRAKPGHDGQAI